MISRSLVHAQIKIAAFSLWLNLAMEVNRHFLESEYGDLSFYYKYGPVLSVEQETIIKNVNLASNRDHSHGTIIRIYVE